MNKTFKTIWNDARRCYIVANEAQKSHGKPSKSAIALAVAATAVLTMGAAQAAYVEQGLKATASFNVDAAVASWETDEYQADWGLAAMHASKAYALGYHGQGVAVGVMDSGALLQGHPDLAGDRFHASHAEGQFGSDGVRYPQGAGEQFDEDYKKGEAFDITGDWVLNVNDSHGTHVTGTVGGNRDGVEFHGVSWGSQIWVGNTGGTDDTNYGPFLDHDYFRTAWGNLANDLIKANGGDPTDAVSRSTSRGGVINNSFGTNTRIVDPDPDTVNKRGPDGGSTDVHFPTNSVADIEYEYFLFNKVYSDKPYHDEEGQEQAGGKNFVDAAWEAVKGTNVVQVFTTGNRDFANPFYRPLYPYFNPEAEKNWVAVAGLQQDGNGGYEIIGTFNEAGHGKWWTVTAPGSGIYSSAVVEGSYVTPGVGEGAGKGLGDYTYAAWSGTSMAAPHVTGAMGVLMSRYQDMTAVQIRDVLFTTANHKNPDGTNMIGWDNADGTKVADDEVSDRMGWGVPDLNKGMYGLGQLLGTFEYNMATAKLDVWSNDITAGALKQRQREDEAFKKNAEAWNEVYAAYQNGEELSDAQEKILYADMHIVKDKDGNVISVDTEDDLVGIDAKDEAIAIADALKWRAEYYDKQLEAIKDREYKGSLIKSGSGTLVLTGKNVYEGTTEVQEGTLLAFSESIGTDNKVTVGANGTFGVLSSYNDSFTMTGLNKSEASEEDKLTIDLTQGGTLFVDAASNVEVAAVNGATKVSVGLVGADAEQLAKVYKGEAEFSGSITSDREGDFDNVTISKSDMIDSAFFTVGDAEVSEDGSSISVVAESNGKTIADFATTKNAASIAAALDNGPANEFLGSVLSMTEDQVSDALAGLSDDMYSAARNAFAVNSLTVSRTVIEQARSYGEGRAAEFENGRGRIWAAGVGQWMNADGASSSLNVDFGAGFVGAEWIATENTKIGAYFGYGTTKYEGTSGKIDGDDLHYGIYGMSDIGPVGLTYGIGYTTEDRDSIRTFASTANAHSEDATALQVFAEAAYNDFYLGSVNIAPYFGYEWMRIETDGFSEAAMGHDFRMGDVEDDLQVATIGARVTAPVMVGKMPVAFKADVGYSRFFGDTESVTSMQLGNGGAIASIEGEELEGQVNFGLGVTAQIGKRATVGINYTGAYGSDTDTHGIGAALRVNF